MSLCCAYGNRGHPVARIIRVVFTAYFEAVKNLVKCGESNKLIAAWLKIRRRVRDLPHPFSQQFHGLLHNTIQWLEYLGWKHVNMCVFGSF